MSDLQHTRVLPPPALWHDPETGQWKKLTKPDRPTYEPYWNADQMREALARHSAGFNFWDEQAQFEFWVRSTPGGDEINLARLHGSNGQLLMSATYRDKEVEAMWIAWQARASIAKATVPAAKAGKGGDHE